MVKEKITSKKAVIPFYPVMPVVAGIFVGLLIASGIVVYSFEKKYSGKIYPGVRLDGMIFGGKNPEDVERYFNQKSLPFRNLSVTLTFEDKISTISASDLSVSYDGKLSAAQAYSIGRTGNLLSDTYQKWHALTAGINLPIVLKMNTDQIDETLGQLAASIDVEPHDALFQFQNGKVLLFKPSISGRKLDKDQLKQQISSYIKTLAKEDTLTVQPVTFALPVVPVNPRVTTENSNNFGIRSLIGVGRSKFAHSIPGRIHNVELAASVINGHLVAPGATFSFNDTLGDVSAATGFQQAYIIKNGRTVLGDGGGVCQVSTTLFRAAMNAGLPILERHAHSYRVGYYEEDSPPGLDATVFSPSYDLKIKNDTPNYLLIQAVTDTDNLELTFNIYGTSDGRVAQLTKPVVTNQTPPPPDLFQDDPTLPAGSVKQVDFAAWGAKVRFDYTVTRNNEVLEKQTFLSDFQPWQAVFLKGTKT